MKREKERSKRKRLSPFSFLEQPGGSISAPILLVSLLLPLHPWHGIMGGGCHPSSKTQGEDRRLLSFHNPLMASARERGLRYADRRTYERRELKTRKVEEGFFIALLMEPRLFPQPPPSVLQRTLRREQKRLFSSTSLFLLPPLDNTFSLLTLLSPSPTFYPWHKKVFFLSLSFFHLVLISFPPSSFYFPVARGKRTAKGGKKETEGKAGVD